MGARYNLPSKIVRNIEWLGSNISPTCPHLSCRPGDLHEVFGIKLTLIIRAPVEIISMTPVFQG